MTTRTARKKSSTVRQMFLLDRAKQRPRHFFDLQPEVLSTVAAVRQSVAKATKDSLWVSYEEDLTEALIRAVYGPAQPLGRAVLVHRLSPQSLPALTGYFQRIAFASGDGILPSEELAEALGAENAADLFIGGSIDHDHQTITLWRGNLEPLTVPFSAFPPSGDGTTPDFRRFTVTDSGQTVRLGDYEAATDAVLYEFDPEYRRRIAKQRRMSERSFGASVRRLRLQRGLRREDFEPEVSAKTIARIEQGKVEQIHKKTLETLAQRLQVEPEEIATF